MERAAKNLDPSSMLIADKDFWISDQANALFSLSRHHW